MLALPILSSATNSIQLNGYVVINNNNEVRFEVGNEVIINPPFAIDNGSKFQIDIKKCGLK